MRTADGYLINKCLNGDTAAFGLLVDKYKEGVYALAYSRLRNFHDAEDVAQEVFIKAYKKLSTLRLYDSFHAYLYAVTCNLCKNWLRARSRRPDKEYIEDKDPVALETLSMDSYRDGLSRESLHESLQEALDSLPEMHRQVLELYYLGGMSCEEIAVFLGASPTAIWQRLSRARAQLREEMIAMMSRAYESQKLRGGFTLRIVEAVKRINTHPIPRDTGVPWGISLATGLILAVLGIGSHPNSMDFPTIPESPSLFTEAGAKGSGEIPATLINGAEILSASIPGKPGEGNVGESVQKAPANAAAPAPGGHEYSFVRSWPEEIIGLRSPCDVELDRSGNLLVADSSNYCIRKFDSEGNLLKTWGTFGRDDGQFDFPSSIAIDSSGNAYVAEGGINDRVQKFDSEGNFLLKWGTSGNGNGQFNRPRGIAVDGSGNVYVSEIRNHRIQKFNAEGTFLLKWGSEGVGDGQFKWPYGIVVDSSGNVYVADNGNYRVQKFDSNGKFLTKWGSQGKGDGQFQNAHGIAIDAAGNVIVSDTSNCRVQKFTPEGKFLNGWGFFGYGDEQLFWPYGIVVDKAGNVYLGDGLRSRVQKFDQNGNFLKNIGGTNTGGQLNNPCGLALDKAGNVYVVDQANLCIQKFDPDGKFLKKWGEGGFGIGQFSWPYGIAVDESGNVYVADPNVNQRIHIFDSNGKFLKNLGSGMGVGVGNFGDCVGVAINSHGDIYVVERGNNRVQVFDSNGRFQRTWGNKGNGDGQFYWCEGVAIDASDNVYVADTGNNRIQVFDSKGNFLTKWGTEGTEDGQFEYPSGIAVDSSSRVYVVDSSNYRIQVFDSNGRFLTKWGEYGAGDMEFIYPSYGIAVSKSGDVYVSDTYNNRIKVFRSPSGGSVDPINKQSARWGQLKRTDLYQNYPNPFNPEAWIPYQLAEGMDVTISICSISGQHVRTLALGQKPVGIYTSREKAAYWDGRDDLGAEVASGVYFYCIQAGDFSNTKKMAISR